MKAMSIAIVLFLTVQQADSQTVYSLQADTRGNHLELTVANESADIGTGKVSVQVVKHPSAMTFREQRQVLAQLGPKGESTITFVFDVGRNVVVGKRDTLEFQIADEGGASWWKPIIVEYAAPATFALDQNFPNPFNPVTTIQYQLPSDSRMTLKVYDILGMEVVTLVNEDRPAGYHDARWDAANVASGVYFYRMEARPTNGGQSFQQIKKLMVVK